MEGPFGEWTGYYEAEKTPEPVIHVQALYHRNDPIILGVPPEKFRGSTWHFGLPSGASRDRDLVGRGVECIHARAGSDPDQHVRTTYGQCWEHILSRVGRVETERSQLRFLDGGDEMLANQLIVVDDRIGAAMTDDDNEKPQVPEESGTCGQSRCKSLYDKDLQVPPRGVEPLSSG